MSTEARPGAEAAAGAIADPEAGVEGRRRGIGRRRRGLSRALVLGLLAVGASWALLHPEPWKAEALAALAARSGGAAPVLFMAFYALATVFFLPGSALTLTGGALFGPWWGTLYSLTAATAGATLAFLVARYVASDWVARKAGARLGGLVQGVEDEGWRFVAFVRLVPLFPFNFLNYALGLTRVSLLHYVVASYVCMLPGAAAYTYLGYAGREALTGGAGMIGKGVTALGLLAAAALLPRLVTTLRRGMR